MEIKIKPKKITKENFLKYGDLISKENIQSINMSYKNQNRDSESLGYIIETK